MIFFKLLTLFIVTRVLVESANVNDGISLAFVIDLTASMGDDLAQVKIGTQMILDKFLKMGELSPIYDYVLQIFRDPKVNEPIITKSAQVLRSNLKKLNVHSIGNSDCPELSMSGIQKAAEVVRNGSTLYVFTDASSKDYYLYPKIRPLLMKKQIKVTFILTSDCGGTSDVKYQIYNKVAKENGGQVFRVTKSDVDEFMKTLLDTIGSYEIKQDDTSDKSGKISKLEVKPEDKVLIIQVTGKANSNIKGELYNPQGKIVTEADGLKIQFKKLSNIYSVIKENPEAGKWTLKLITKSTDFTKKVSIVKNETWVAHLKQKKSNPGNSAVSLVSTGFCGFGLITTVITIFISSFGHN